jgi:hypothetical protein
MSNFDWLMVGGMVVFVVCGAIGAMIWFRRVDKIREKEWYTYFVSYNFSAISSYGHVSGFGNTSLSIPKGLHTAQDFKEAIQVIIDSTKQEHKNWSEVQVALIYWAFTGYSQPPQGFEVIPKGVSR